jgi:hypothetical protein
MRVLTRPEQAAWIDRHGLPAEPYRSGGEKFKFYLQFHTPKTLRSIECFTEGVLNLAGLGGEVMMTIVDTEISYDFQVRLFDRLRFPMTEPKAIVDSPGHLFDSDEVRDVIPMFSLTVGWGWEAYLHMPRSRTVLLNWEGDIFDVWTDDQSVFSGICGMLKTFGLNQTDTAQPAVGGNAQ